MSHTTAASTLRPHGRMRGATRIFNGLVLPLAGTRFLSLYGVIHHRGRRSGTEYHTPVVVRATSGGFIVPMPFGEATDWYRNVRAAGRCVVRWKGREHNVTPASVLDGAAAAGSFGALERSLIARFGIKDFLVLHRDEL